MAILLIGLIMKTAGKIRISGRSEMQYIFQKTLILFMFIYMKTKLTISLKGFFLKSYSLYAEIYLLTCELI